MTHGIFHIVAKNPEIQHIPGEVHETTMHEHGSEYCEFRRD